MTDVVRDALYARSSATWRLIRRGHDAQVRANEETLTNLILIELSLMKAAGLVVRAFTKQMEAENGADWEMWLGDSSGRWLGLRIQAKAIELNSPTYKHLHYRKDNTVPFQSDTLIEKALTSIPRRWPLYLLYTYAPPGALPTDVCSLYPRRRVPFGCSAISAFHVQALRSPTQKNSLAALSSYMFPWHCLVCSCHDAEASLPDRVAAYLESQLAASYAEAARPEDSPGPAPGGDEESQYPIARFGRPDISVQPPDYVTALMANRGPSLPDDLCAVVAIQDSRIPEPVR